MGHHTMYMLIFKFLVWNLRGFEPGAYRTILQQSPCTHRTRRTNPSGGRGSNHGAYLPTSDSQYSPGKYFQQYFSNLLEISCAGRGFQKTKCFKNFHTWNIDFSSWKTLTVKFTSSESWGPKVSWWIVICILHLNVKKNAIHTIFVVLDFAHENGFSFYFF